MARNTVSPTTRLDVSWSAPDVTGKPALSGYDVRYRKAGASWSTHTFTGTGTNTTLTGLDANYVYQVEVRGVNDEGDGAWSDTASLTTRGDAEARSVPENSASGANVGAAVTLGSNGFTMSHSLSGTDAGQFLIASATGQITVRPGTSLDYETRTSYSVVVNISVSGTGSQTSGPPNAAGSYTIPVTITVTDVNEVARFTTGKTTRGVAENSAAGTNVGAPVTATDPDNDTLTYSLAGADGDKFDIDSSTSQIAVKNAIDYESRAFYNVKVNASDGSLVATIDVTINVSDVNEPPPAPGAPSKVSATTGSLEVTWSAPDTTGRPDVDDYDLRYREKGVTAWTDVSHNGAGTTATITGLRPSADYEVQARANNDEGSGPWSATGSMKTPAVATPTPTPKPTSGGAPYSPPAPTATPFPTATPAPATPTPSRDAFANLPAGTAPTPGALPQQQATAVPTATPVPQATAVPTAVPAATAAPEATATPARKSTATPVAEATAVPTATAVPEETPAAETTTETETTPVPTATPVPEATAVPTAAPSATPVPVVASGLAEEVAAGGCDCLWPGMQAGALLGVFAILAVYIAKRRRYFKNLLSFL